MHWPLNYILLIGVPLLALFSLCGAVLLVRRRGLAQWHHSPQSIATPYGYIPWEDINTQHMFAQGIERARHRQYCNPRGD